ncbi:MAG: 4Fe-4S binding protein [Vallitaleaceae bacterium]|jgi:ferredoxin-type protein NapH|nr:4Fe-4S binding protein [Vallitaleaceae bacterium]
MKKRQKIRRTIVFLLFLLFPVYINFLSPVLIIGGAYEGIINGSFIVFGILFFVTLFGGRLWCGWVCPAGGLQESCEPFVRKTRTKNWGLLIKYIYWVSWLGLIAMFFIKAGGVKSINFFYMSGSGISILDDIIVIVYLSVILLIFILNVTLGQRSFCKYVCWMSPFMEIGNNLRFTFKLPGLRLKADSDACISCGKCNKTCPMSIDVQTNVSKGMITDINCHMCYQCADVCPNGCIHN